MANDAHILRVPNPVDNSVIEVRFEADYILRLFKTEKTSYCNLEKWYIRDNVSSPFPPDKVFVVYLNERMSIYDFRAEYEDDEDKLSPRDWKNRFGGVIWKITS